MAIWPRRRYWNDVKPPRDALPDLEHRLAQGLVGDWNMSEGEGLMAFDRAGMVRGSPTHGTLVNGPTWVAGDRGGTILAFDGATNYVQVPNFDLPSSKGSLSIWLRPSTDLDADGPSDIYFSTRIGSSNYFEVYASPTGSDADRIVFRWGTAANQFLRSTLLS